MAIVPEIDKLLCELDPTKVLVKCDLCDKDTWIDGDENSIYLMQTVGSKFNLYPSRTEKEVVCNYCKVEMINGRRDKDSYIAGIRRKYIDDKQKS